MGISKTAILAETIARKTTSKVYNKIELKGDFPQQQAFIEDTSRYLVAQCSRRAGKTNGLAIRFFQTLERHPKSQCIYLALTLDSAREILWPVLIEMNDKYSLGCSFIESKLTMKHPNGSTLKLFGADMKNFIKRLKGRKYPGVGIDEAQDFGSHLQSLVDDVLTPSISDYEDGWLALTGTPGPVPTGYYFQVTQESKFGYSIHKWTSLDNPYMPNNKAFLDDIKIKREWTDEHPTFQREYLNKWVLDKESLWVKYSKEVNDYSSLPDNHKWDYVFGIDIGFRDADAIAVLAWSDTCLDTYLVEECIHRKQGLTELVEQIQYLQNKYKPVKMVIDEGGLGKKLAEELRRRYAIPVEPADKMRKQENVELLNDTLRLAKFKAKSTSMFAQDSYKIQLDWDKTTPNRVVIKKNPHSDVIDAVLYAFKESYSYLAKKPSNTPVHGSKEWADQQSKAMFEAAMEQAQEEQRFNRWMSGQQD